MSANVPSSLLTEEENDLVFTIVGHRKQSKATAVVQMYHAFPERGQWSKFKTGVVCFVKDNVKKSYYIRLIDIMAKSIVYEQEVYNQFSYKPDRPYFHSFPGDKFTVGLNFASEKEADKFREAVESKIQERTIKRAGTRKRQPSSSESSGVNVIGRPPVAPINDSNDPFSSANKQGRPRRPKGKKINKSDIGLPSDFRHLAHVGFDPVTGAFDSSNITPEWKRLLDNVGISQEQLEDQETANFIYDFVEKNGGISKVTKKIEEERKTAAPPPPPPSRHGGMGGASRHTQRRDHPPPPPSRGGPPPPPPSRGGGGGGGGNVPAPPPPPPIGGPPPPPPLPSGGGAGGPPPPRQRDTPSLPPVDNSRSNLLSSIREGFKLKPVDTTSTGGGGGGGSAAADPEMGGLADALKRAMEARSVALKLSDDSEEDWGEDEEDDEWGFD